MIAPPMSAAPLSTIMLLRMLIGCVERVEHEHAAAVVAGVVALDQVAVDVDRRRCRRPSAAAADRQLGLDRDAAPESTESL